MRGHDLIRVFGNDALPNRGSIGIAWHDGRAVLALFKGTFRGVEPEIAFARLGVEAVARETSVGEEGANIRVEAEVPSLACGHWSDR